MALPVHLKLKSNRGAGHGWAAALGVLAFFAGVLAVGLSLILPAEALAEDMVDSPPNGALRICGADGQCVTEAGVSCPASDSLCVSGPMRAVPVEGRLEVAWDGMYGTICDDYWTNFDADVACRDIGHAAGQRSYRRSHFGGAERGVPIWFDDVQCLGSEATLAACRRKGGTGSAGSHNCSRRHTEDAGVRCLEETTATPTVAVRPTTLTVAPGDTAGYWVSLTKRPDNEDFWAAPRAPAGGAVTVSPDKVWMTNDERGWAFAQWVGVAVSADARVGASHTIAHETTAYAYRGGAVPVPDVTLTVAGRSSGGAAPRLSISVDNARIAENGGTATVTIGTGAAFQSDQIITLAVSGTATENTDYGIGSKSLTLVAGETSVATTVTASDDADDDDETVIITASAGGNVVGSVTVTIADDDAAPDIAVSFDADAYAATEGGAAALVTVTLSRAPTAAVAIPLTVAGVGGAATGDYSLTPANATLAFGTSETSRTLTVTAIDDADNDDGESLTIGFGNLPTGFAAATPTSTTVNLTDNDTAAPTVANAIPDQTATAGTAFGYQFPASTFDDADGDTLTYAATRADGTALPAWLSFAAATRTFSGARRRRRTRGRTFFR